MTHSHKQFPIRQKKSRDESKGAGSGVEILINEPYEDGPGGQGQYTRKIYHVGSHLPGWIKGTPYEKKNKSKIFNRKCKVFCMNFISIWMLLLSLLLCIEIE